MNGNGTLGLSEVQNYYPLGKDMGDATMNYTASPQNLYKYSSKEIQQELSLMDYDFGARHYDPRIGRWQGIDALAEKYIESSPYNYVANSPVNNYDPDGMVTKPQLQTPSEGYNFDVFGSDPWGAGIASAVLNAVESIHGPSGLAKIDSKDAPKMAVNAQSVAQGDDGGGLANQGGIPPNYKLKHIIKDGIEMDNTPFFILFPVLKSVKTVWNLLNLVKEDPEAELQSIRELKNFKYDSRLQNQTDLYHDFPRSFDRTIIENAPWAQRLNDGANWFEYPGWVNDQPGNFQIGINDQGVIFHRNFVPLP